MSESDPLSQALASDPLQLFSQAHGEGRRYSLGGQYDLPQGHLEVFPKNGVVRYQGEGISIASQFPNPPYVERDRIVFSSESKHESRSLIVTDQGEITLFVSPRPPIQEPDVLDRFIAESDHIEHQIEVMSKTAIRTPEPIAADQPNESLSNIKTAMNTKAETERKDRVELTGNVGRDPRLSETAKGVLIAKFPLAEHPNGEEGETKWHTIVAFKDRAKAVSENVHKGDQVKVIGYRTERQYKDKTIEEINAVVVKPPKLGGASELTSSTGRADPAPEGPQRSGGLR